MAKAPKMTVCRTCSNPIAANAKVCPHCGAKNKKPIYKRGWFILLVVVVVIAVIGSFGGGKDVPEKEIEAVETPEVKAPAEETQAVKTPEPVQAGEKSPAEEEPAAEPSEAEGGLRPEFKEAMDSYEAFYDDYCDLLEKYSENPTDLTLLGEYTEMMTKALEMDEKFAAWEDEDLNEEELKYYVEVSGRIAARTLEFAGR